MLLHHLVSVLNHPDMLCLMTLILIASSHMAVSSGGKLSLLENI